MTPCKTRPSKRGKHHAKLAGNPMGASHPIEFMIFFFSVRPVLIVLKHGLAASRHPLAKLMQPTVKNSTGRCLDRLHPCRRIDDLGKAYAKSFTNHDNLALGDHRAIGQNVQRVSGKAVKLDHRPFV